MAFPSSPSNGQTALVNGITYVYNSSNGTWTRQATQSGNKTTTSTTPPGNPIPGDVWYNPTNDTVLTYTYDGQNYWWVDYEGPTYGLQSSVYGNLTVTNNISAGNVNLNSGGQYQVNGTGFVYADPGQVVITNNRTINSNVTLAANTGAVSVGPISLGNGYRFSLGANCRYVIL